jgi:hypothetical protein
MMMLRLNLETLENAEATSGPIKNSFYGYISTIRNFKARDAFYDAQVIPARFASWQLRYCRNTTHL